MTAVGIIDIWQSFLTFHQRSFVPRITEAFQNVYILLLGWFEMTAVGIIDIWQSFLTFHQRSFVPRITEAFPNETSRTAREDFRSC